VFPSSIFWTRSFLPVTARPIHHLTPLFTTSITTLPHFLLARTDSTPSYTPCLYLCPFPGRPHDIIP
jgi:hypothetical protein